LRANHNGSVLDCLHQANRQRPNKLRWKLRPVQFLMKGTLARNAGWMLLGQGLRLVIQALYFTVIARSLGASKYGAFVGVVGLVGIFLPFASLGSGYILIKNVARDPKQFRSNWGRTLATTFCSSATLFGAILFFAWFVLPPTIPFLLVVCVSAADLFGYTLTEICGHAFLAFDHVKWTAFFSVLVSTSRCGAAVILAVLCHDPTALQWGQFYFGSTSVVALIALVLTLVILGTPSFDFTRSPAEEREGFYVSLGKSAGSIYNDIDKTMLARMGTLEATGIYGAAYRLIEVSFAPVASLLVAAYPNFLRVGRGGISATLRYANSLILHALCYAALISLAVLAGAGIVPHVLGGEYRSTVEALRWLAVLPILRVPHFFLSDALAGADHQGLKASIQIGVAAFNVLINLWIIPAYSWRGAAWSSVASDALLACAMGAAAMALSRRSRRGTPDAKILEASAEA
jgi:O-antigen/teichoic acid export membrane protein